MSGRTKIHLALFYALFCDLVIHIVPARGGMPIIHSVPLQNETIVPDEYRNLPLVGKCCPEKQILMKDESGTAVCTTPNSTEGVFSPYFSTFNRTGMLVPGDEYPRFVAIVGDPCKFKRYMLYPEESSDDEYYLLINGSIFSPRLIPTMLQPGVDYCMEIVPELGLRALVCFPEDRMVTTADSRITIYAFGLLISVPFLIVTIVAYSITPKLRDVYGKALCMYCTCLALAFMTLAITQLSSVRISDQCCVYLAFIIHFSFVTCFFWLNVMCIHTLVLVWCYVDRDRYNRINPRKLFFYYSMWGWGSPTILVIVAMLMDLSPTIPTTYLKPSFGAEICWFKSDDKAMAYYYVPVGLLLLANVILFVLTSVKLSRYQQDLAMRRLARNQESDRLDQRLLRRLRRSSLVCLVLFFLMGLNWTMEVISWWVGGDPLDWKAFDFMSALQGVLVFGLFVLRRPPRDFVWHRIQKFLGKDVAEPEVGSMDLSLLPVMNGDSIPRHTIVP